MTFRPGMYFAHSSAVWRQFPQLVPGVLVLDSVRPGVIADGEPGRVLGDAEVRRYVIGEEAHA